MEKLGTATTHDTDNVARTLIESTGVNWFDIDMQL